MKNLGIVMSNFDHKIEEGIEEKLKKGDCICEYAAQNFFGKNIRFENGIFKCDIIQYRSFREIIEGKNLKEIMEKASKKYGAS